jgi:hypothetical protein
MSFENRNKNYDHKNLCKHRELQEDEWVCDVCLSLDLDPVRKRHQICCQNTIPNGKGRKVAGYTNSLPSMGPCGYLLYMTCCVGWERKIPTVFENIAIVRDLIWKCCKCNGFNDPYIKTCVYTTTHSKFTNMGFVSKEEPCLHQKCDSCYKDKDDEIGQKNDELLRQYAMINK